MSLNNNFLIIILGPTGIGKTNLSIEIAKHFDTEIISSDSRQIYKELKIGTAVPSEEQLQTVRHHFIGNKSIFDYYNVSMYEIEVNDFLSDFYKNKSIALLVGGSGMYIDAVCNGIDDLPQIDFQIRNELQQKFENEGIESLRFELKRLDPDHYLKVDLKNHKRILKALEICLQTGKTYTSFLTNPQKKRNFKTIKIGLNRNRTELHDIINQRVDKMVEEGLIDEAKTFYQYRNLNSLNTVGYKEFFDYLDGKTDLETAIELLKRNTRRYARRQLTWFHKDTEIKWFEPHQKKEIIDYINQNFKKI
jgi:tRNA dimethylallyltransferase